MTRHLFRLTTAGVLVLALALSAGAYVAYYSHTFFLETLTKDLLKLVPRAMGSYIYQNRYDFLRGMTFMTRDIAFNVAKVRDVEEIRREAYERLMRDIPYCVEAFKGGDIKLDTSHNNLSGRLGMIAYSIVLLKTPDFPDLEYLERFTRTLDEAVGEHMQDIWVYYDGYPDFCSLGELMESLKVKDMPTFLNVRNDARETRDAQLRPYAGTMKEDIYSVFRAPEKFIPHIVITDKDINRIYNNIVNCVADAYIFIWKASGVDLAHPSYSAPPGTVIERGSRRRFLPAGILARVPLTPEPAGEEAVPSGEEEREEGPPVAPPGPLPARTPGVGR